MDGRTRKTLKKSLLYGGLAGLLPGVASLTSHEGWVRWIGLASIIAAGMWIVAGYMRRPPTKELERQQFYEAATAAFGVSFAVFFMYFLLRENLNWPELPPFAVVGIMGGSLLLGSLAVWWRYR